MRTLIFARDEHPKGYGLPDGRALGFVVLAVDCNSLEIEELVIHRLGTGWTGNYLDFGYSNGNLTDWYGGSFDCIGYCNNFGTLAHGGDIKARFISLGDNRFVGHYTADEIILPFKKEERKDNENNL